MDNCKDFIDLNVIGKRIEELNLTVSSQRMVNIRGVNQMQSYDSNFILFFANGIFFEGSSKFRTYASEEGRKIVKDIMEG